jgi:hypothetical protein
MFTSLVGSAAQEACLEAAFTGRLGTRLNEEFIAVKKIFRNRARERNRLAHGVIGVGEAHPDGIIVCPSDVFARYIADDLSMRAANALYRGSTQPIYPPEFLTECLVYKAHDFKQINQRISEALTAYIKLSEQVHTHLLEEKKLDLALDHGRLTLEDVLHAQEPNQSEPQSEDSQPKPE